MISWSQFENPCYTLELCTMNQKELLMLLGCKT